MNKVITINLGGTAFQLEDAGYDALHSYLERARARLAGNPDRDEIISDIERSIGDKFRSRLSAHKNVVLASEVQEVLQEMGEIRDDSGEAGEPPSSAGAEQTSGAGGTGAGSTTGGPRRLYRVLEGRQLSGVCNGLGIYLNLDPTIVRLAFVALTLAWGAGILLYLVMAIVIPVAETPAQKAAAAGEPATAEDFIRRAKQGYYDAMRSVANEDTRREWKRRARQFRREWDDNAARWRYQWSVPPTTHPGAGLGLPLLSAIHAAIVFALLASVVSLLATGAWFGIALPFGLPVWAALLLLLIFSGFFTWPLKAARHSIYRGMYGGSPGTSLFVVTDILVWFVVIAFFVWLARDYHDLIREAFHNLPTVIRDGADAIREWWQR